MMGSANSYTSFWKPGDMAKPLRNIPVCGFTKPTAPSDCLLPWTICLLQM